METVHRLVRSLRTARSAELPTDSKSAFFMLMSMVMQNQHRSLNDLLETNTQFDLNFTSGVSNRTLLHVAANVGAYESLTCLLKRGASVNVQDRQGITPLQVASRNGYKQCIGKLLEYHADISITNNEGMTAVHWLASNGRVELLGEMSPHITDIDMEDWNGQTALHVACLNGHLKTVYKLLEMNADINKKDWSGCTPIFRACSNGHAAIVRELLSKGASLTCNKEREYPHEVALKGGYGEVCLVLVENDPKVLNILMKLCQNDSMDYEKAMDVLTFFSTQTPSLHNDVLLNLAILVHSEGMHLLSPSSEYNYRMKSFLRTVKLMCDLFAIRPNSLKKARSDSSVSRSGSFLRRGSRPSSSMSDKNYGSPILEPEIIDKINYELISLWSVLNSWMSIIKGEMSEHSSVSSQTDLDKGNLKDNKLTDLQTVASALREKRTTAFERQSSTAHLELRLSQPAMEFNLNQYMQQLSPVPPTPDSDIGSTEIGSTDIGSTDIGSTENESSSLNEGDSPIRRSLSYQTAVLSLDIDIGGRDEEVIEVQPSHEVAVPSEASSSTNTVISSERFPSTSIVSPTTNTPPVMTTTSQEDDDAFQTVATQVVDATADRLCAAIHGYFLYCQNAPYWENSSSRKMAFNDFIETHEEVLKLLVARKSLLIFEHFSFLLDNPLFLQRFLPVIHAQPFEDRRKWFYDNLDVNGRPAASLFDDTSLLLVNRESLLPSSCEQLMKKDGSVLKKNIAVRFNGEEGVGDGVVREWLDLLVKEVLNPDFALFTLSADGATFQPNSHSAVNPDHLSYFRFAGRIMGLAMYHRQLINAYFTRSFYKHILGIPVNYADVESLDPQYSKNLQWILDNDITDLGLDIPFSIETDVFGQMQEIELKADGANIQVTEQNKFEYVYLAADLRMTKGIRTQLYAFLEGFHEFIPHSLVSLFNEYELELIMNGLPEIDIEDWKKNASYQAGYDADSPVIKWFWDVVSEFSQQEAAMLLQFATGTSRVPWGGFAQLSGSSGSALFTICLSPEDHTRLPTASTCFNMLKLPAYESKEELRTKLLTAISIGCLGFEFA